MVELATDANFVLVSIDRLLQKFSALAYLCSQKTEAACKNDCSWRADIAKCDIGIELYHPDLLFCPWGKVSAVSLVYFCNMKRCIVARHMCTTQLCGYDKLLICHIRLPDACIACWSLVFEPYSHALQGAGQLVCEVAENNEDCEDLSDCQWLEPSSTDLSQIAQLEPIIQAAMGAPASSKSSFGNASPQTSQQPNLGSVQRSDNGDVLPTEPTCLPKRVTYLEYVNSVSVCQTARPGVSGTCQHARHDLRSLAKPHYAAPEHDHARLRHLCHAHINDSALIPQDNKQLQQLTLELLNATMMAER